MRCGFKANRAAAPVLRAQAAIKIIATMLLCAAGTVGAADATDPAARVAEGRALYRGTTPWRQPPTLHGVALASGANACAACHGTRGEARTEAGVAVPAIQWQRLAQGTSTRPAYADPAQVVAALSDGRAGDGRAFNAPMPRFALDAAEQQALAAYLRVLGTEADPVAGVDAQRIVLGSVLPLTGPQAAAGAAIRTALGQRMERINAAGGIFGRRLELVVADAGADSASALAAADGLVRSGRVFALVASLMPAPDAALRKTLAATDTAMVATLGLPVSTARDAQVSWLLPSLAQQVRELATELQRSCAGPTTAAGTTRVLYLRDGALNPTTVELPGAQWQPIASADDVRDALVTTPAARTVALLPAALVATARESLSASVDKRHSPACLGTLAALSGEPATASDGLRELVALPMPPVLLDDGADARAVLWPMLADSALAVTAEALSRAGRQLDGAKLVAALDTVHRFEPRSGLVLDFSRQRRHGLDVSYLWKEGSHETRSPRR